MRTRTLDREADAFFTTEKIGRTQEVTPEGFLLCRDVRIARTGEMLYGDGETPVEVGRDRIARVTRGPEDLFRPETIASFNGKDIVDEHPDEDVNPDNHSEVTCGVVLNPHQGEGADAEFLMCDFLIKTAAGIEAVKGGKREVSAGYDADYEQTGPGRGRQFNIIGNHVALVDAGRCGPRCAIGDHDMKTRDAKKTRSWKDRVMTAFKARDEEALTEAMEMAQDEMTDGVDGDTGPGTEHKIVVEVRGPTSNTEAQTAQDEDPDAKKEDKTEDDGEEAPAWFKSFADDVTKRLTALEAGRTSDEEKDPDDEDDGEKKTEDEDELDLGKTEDDEADEDDKGEKKDDDKGTKDRARTGDSAGLSKAFQDMVARAEILAPGIKLPTFDAKATRKVTRDRMCAFRRRALVRSLENAETRDILSALVARDPDLTRTTCDGVSVLFTAASELVKSANTAITSTGFVHDGAGAGKGPASISEINQKNRDFWRAKGGAL